MSRSKTIAALLFILTIAGALLYVNPLIEKHTLAVEDVDAKRAELDVAVSKKEDTETTKREFDALSRADKDRYLNAFPSGTIQESIINAAVDVAQSANLSLSSLSFSKNLNQSSPKRLSVIANFTGSSDPGAVLGLVKGIEQSKRLLTVRGLSFVLAAEKQDYTLTLEGYYK